MLKEKNQHKMTCDNNNCNINCWLGNVKYMMPNLCLLAQNGIIFDCIMLCLVYVYISFIKIENIQQNYNNT